MGRRAFQVMGGGLSQGNAIAINGSMNNTVSAAGTTQGTATTLGAGNNLLTTVASGAGVIMPQGQPGDELDIFNMGANACLVYPATSAKINSLATNGAFTLATNTGCKVKQWSTTQYTVLLSA